MKENTCTCEIENIIDFKIECLEDNIANECNPIHKLELMAVKEEFLNLKKLIEMRRRIHHIEADLKKDSKPKKKPGRPKKEHTETAVVKE